MPGFQFTETMAGHYTRDGRERSLSFQATARASSMWQFMKDRTATLDGVIDAEGLAENSPMHGSITIDPFIGRIIKYDFEFTAADGKVYRFAGQKSVSHKAPITSMTSLPAEITDDKGRVIAKAHVHFQGKHMLPFLASWRPVL